MELKGLPPKQGLYDPMFEHDACGIGVVANIKGKKSHKTVEQAITTLENLTHRGCCGSEANTGDGAGILIQIPHKFFLKACKEENITLPEPLKYGVGMLFLPQDEKMRATCEKELEEVIKSEGQTLLGWRAVPFDDSQIGNTAKACMPFFKQVFIGRSENISDDMAFERKLYVIRKLTERKLAEKNISFYAASFSSRTIVYKGMLMAEQVPIFYKELADPSLESALALVHSRYSTNTFPSWERAHPNRYIIHNGEINTLRGNINWMTAREAVLKNDLFGDDINKIFPVINQEGSDSAVFDNCFEFLSLSGRPMEHTAMMMIPEPWPKHKSMSDEKRAFYEYHATLMEPWDGPAAIIFSDGVRVGAVLDRNGLRPSRYYITKDDMIVVASEVGVVDIPNENIARKERLHPGKMLLIDTEKGKIITDDEIKESYAAAHPYREWIDQSIVELENLSSASEKVKKEKEPLFLRQKAFGYTFEDFKSMIIPLIKTGVDPIGSMGFDAPLAVLSDKPQLLFNYFKQLFAQVTNPPIDALREELITASELYLGDQGNLISPDFQDSKKIKVHTPVISNEELSRIVNAKEDGIKVTVLPTLFKSEEGGKSLEEALENLFQKADKAIANGSNILVLSDRGVNKELSPIPSLLAVAGLHHHLIRNYSRTKVSIVLESGEPREVHHFALLIGYGASAINPYLVYESVDDLIGKGMLTDVDYDTAVKKYIKIVTKGIVKVLSKMGISTIQSYHGAQIFESIGLSKEVIDKYFTWTPSRIEGIGLDQIAKESAMKHQSAYNDRFADEHVLESGGIYQWKKDGEYHLYNPESIYKLQMACRTGNYAMFKEFTGMINEQSQKHCTLRGLLDFKDKQPIPIDEVEPVESICRRFKTGAMSYGSISQEAHESMAIAMNRIGGKSNTGEGGEDVARFIPMENGDSKCSAIKQVASGRFGVTSNYLTHAKELQIKMAQGAKPGEGGQLPGAKVYPWIARTRYSTPGVGLISPPPHHDIYSIEDLAELIHDLKNANRDARINVKLVSEVGVGTIAAGVAKGHADVVLISGYDGGTGAAPRTSIRHTGLPWELGVAETHQTLVLNNLRSRIVVETDGKLLTGRDLAIAALLGAEEYGFATGPLVTLGCVMMRVCNLDTCPVGVATQNPELRKRFCGDPQNVVNFMHFIAQELREFMAELGFKTVDEMVGRCDKLKMSDKTEHWKAKHVDLSTLLYQPKVSSDVKCHCCTSQDHGLSKSLDLNVLLDKCAPALEKGEKVEVNLPIQNVNRVVGTILGNEVTKRYGGDALPDDTIKLNFNGSAGQSFGAFVPKGITLKLEGDSNDYIGKGLSGGKIVVYPPASSTFVPEENIIVGNVAFYGATSGEAYIRGAAGERFCVRNSGVKAVIEAVGDHGCEYMTGGRVVVLGSTGRNFAAGMSGGIAYVVDKKGDFKEKCNQDMVDLDKLEDKFEIDEVRGMIERHVEYTGSTLGQEILDHWDITVPKIIKVMPKDYKRMLNAIKRVESMGLSGEEALMAAFEANNKDLARLSGN